MIAHMKSISVSLSWIARQLIEMTVYLKKKNQNTEKTTQEENPPRLL